MPLIDTDARERLIRMEAKLDSHLYRTTQAESRLETHDTRIRCLETGHARTLGVATGISALIGTVSAFAMRMVYHAP